MDGAPLLFPICRSLQRRQPFYSSSPERPCGPPAVVPWSLRSRPEGTRMNEAPARETLGFQAEVKQLLHLMIHSLYGNKNIFLRELVSNASDAGDKLRFDAIADAAMLEDGATLTIRVSYDKPSRTITVSDNGVGMSRQEVIEHIGTIAKSGTREFVERLSADRTREAQLIGQFGVGLYAS